MEVFVLYCAICCIFDAGMEAGLYYKEKYFEPIQALLSFVFAPLLVPFYLGCYFGSIISRVK